MLEIVSAIFLCRVAISQIHICTIPDCSVCNGKLAECTTTNPSEIIPLDLPITTTHIELRYYGPTEKLSAPLISRFRNLDIFNLEGNISALENKTFASNPKLSFISISKTQIEFLPDDLFCDDSSIEGLFLPQNKLRRMPGKLLLKSIKYTMFMKLSYNPIEDICPHQLHQEFSNLTKLESLALSGLGNSDICNDLPDDFFSPISHVTWLELAESGFFHGNQRILKVFNGKLSLSLDRVSPYRSCPALAETLFYHLPVSLFQLSVANWQTSKPLDNSCILSHQALRSLGQLPNLLSIDFSYSDGVLGKSLSVSLLSKPSNLYNVYLAYSGLTGVEYGSLNGATRLHDLVLEGNFIGPRAFNSISSHSTPLYNLRSLSLDNCGLSLDQSFVYDGSFLFKDFPELQVISLARNNFYNLPNFSQFNSGRIINEPTNIKTLILSKNLMSSLPAESIKNLCSTMPNLTYLDLSGNRISTISQLCNSLEELYLSSNQLWNNQDKNLAVIQRLKKLVHVDLASNGLKSIPNGTFSDMSLTVLNLRDNAIAHLDDQLFSGSYATLEVLDLSRNRIRLFNTSLISKHRQLGKIYLHGNLISQLSEEFVAFAEDKPKYRHDNCMSYLYNKITCNITVHENPIDCSCGRQYFKKWVITSPYLNQAKELGCETPESQHARKVYAYSESYWDCHAKFPLMIIGAILLCILCTVLIAVPCYRFRWYVSHLRIVWQAMVERAKFVRQEHQYKYDAMICCDESSQSDGEFALELLQKLERGEGDNSEYSDEDIPSHERVNLKPMWQPSIPLILL